MAYSVEGLTAGAGAHGEAALAADAAASALAGLMVAAGAFGTVPSAAGYAGRVESARSRLGRGAGTEASQRAGLSGRVLLAAALGANLTATSTTVASSVTPPSVNGAVVRGME